MADKLLIYAYRVGVGDCIYVRIPNQQDGFHILIDCGTIGSIELLKKAVQDIRLNFLPDLNPQGKKRLDLLVATHRHKDHIKGFDPDFFEDVQIRNIWLSAAMDPGHTQARKSMALHEMVTQTMRGLESQNLSMSPQLEQLVSMYSLENDDAMIALREKLPDKNGIEPVYVHAGMDSSCLNDGSGDASIRVLAPENDIDGYYLGEEFDENLKGFQDTAGFFKAHSSPGNGALPENISAIDFEHLRSRMLSNAFAFADTDSSLQNNTSVVLLIQWRGRRLLFTGDAEWEAAYKAGIHNGSWNVMWNKHHELLNNSLDFIKVGHHGSYNATPWCSVNNQSPEVNQILEAMLPLPVQGSQPLAQAIVSTERTNVYEPIPAPELLVELGKRVKNIRNYYASLKAKDINFENKKPFKGLWDYERVELLKKPQPWRTDLEYLLSGEDFVKVEIEPGD